MADDLNVAEHDAHSAVAAVADAVSIETAATVARALESAEARIEAAEETAEQIAEAAIESERGRRIATLEGRMNECAQNVELLRNEMTNLAATLLLLTPTPLAQPVVDIPIPPASTETVTTETVTVEPVTASENDVAVQEAPPVQKRRRILV